MDYFTNFTYLYLEGHVELEKYRYVYFLITLSVYMLIICCNVAVISVIYNNSHLHEPMYIFVAALLCNDFFRTFAFYPKVLIDFLSETPVITHGACLFQAFWIYTYGVSEFTLLSAMAYDRYVSICKPLQYPTLIKMSTVRTLLFCCWLLPSCEIGISIILTYHLQLCRFKLNRIYCNVYSIVKLSCGDTTVNYLYGLIALTLAVFVPVIFVIYSYVRILDVCLRNSKDFRRKALQTCFPHLVIFISYSVICCFDMINSRVEGNMPHIVSIIMSVENLFFAPLINPIMYGLKLQEIRNRIRRMIWKRKTHSFAN